MSAAAGGVLVVNPGSSSIKVSVVDPAGAAHHQASAPASADLADLLAGALADAPDVVACGVRVVHAGPRLRASVLASDEVIAEVDAAGSLAPAHNPVAVAAMRTARALIPGLPVVACLDTAFHATLPPAASTYAVPWRWTQEWGIRRLGFHGFSHAWASRRAAAMLGREPAGLRVVTCHLGAGASLAAVAGGRSVDTTMGFTPLDGLVMATRPGALDPGVLLELLRSGRVGLRELDDALERGSGLLGMTGIADMREVLARAAAGDAVCVAAVDVSIHRLVQQVGAMVASLGGVDALVFTGGVGEAAPEVRRRACDRLQHLGVVLDAGANDACRGGDAAVGARDAPAAVLVVTAREDLEMARAVRAVLDGRSGEGLATGAGTAAAS